MTRYRILTVCEVGLLLLTATLTQEVQAEIWTDRTGQFQVEAEYVGVHGTSVVLRKVDGTTINVPIDRLSNESRDRAKKLYEAAKSGKAVSSAATKRSDVQPVANLESASDIATPATRNRSEDPPAAATNFTLPVPPSVPPMPDFPEDATLQESVDFVRAQMLSGHPEVFWYALPEHLRSVVDSSEYRTGILSQQHSTFNDALMKMLMKVVELLVTKKEFVLNSQLMTQVPPAYQALVKQAYDPAVGMMYEFAMLTLAIDDLKTMTITQFVDNRGSRFGGHLRALAQQLPPGMIDQIIPQVQVQQDDATHGSITISKPEGGADTIQMMKVDGRWLPDELAKKWEESGDDFAEIMNRELEKMKLQQESAKEIQQPDAMMVTTLNMVGGLIEPLLAANSQEQFDAALLQLEATARMFSGIGAGGPTGMGGASPPTQNQELEDADTEEGVDSLQRLEVPGGPRRIPIEPFP